MEIYFMQRPIATAPSSPLNHIHGSALQQYLFSSVPPSPAFVNGGSSGFLLKTPTADNVVKDFEADEFEFIVKTSTSSSDNDVKCQFMPLKPPPRLQSPQLSMPAPRKGVGRTTATAVRRVVVGVLSFKNKDFDPFVAAAERIRSVEEEKNYSEGSASHGQRDRKKERVGNRFNIWRRLRNKAG